jgi:hypothetical protein
MPTTEITRINPETHQTISNSLQDDHLFSINVSKSGNSELVFGHNVTDEQAQAIKGHMSFSFPLDENGNCGQGKRVFYKQCVIVDGKKIS